MILNYIKSRVKGDLQARFRERLAGETPACLLDLTGKKVKAVQARGKS